MKRPKIKIGSRGKTLITHGTVAVVGLLVAAESYRNRKSVRIKKAKADIKSYGKKRGWSQKRMNEEFNQHWEVTRGGQLDYDVKHLKPFRGYYRKQKRKKK